MSMRPALRPGSRVLRRDAHHLAIGTTPAVVVPDRPGLWALLGLVDGVHDLDALVERARTAIPELHDVASIIRELVAAGALVDGRTRTRRPRVEVVAADPSARALAASIRASGREAGWRLGHDADSTLVVVSCDEPARGPIELALLQRRPVLTVTALADIVRVGPFAIVGASPCLGCLDLERTQWSPGWSTVLTELEHTTAIPSPPGATAAVSCSAVGVVVEDVMAVAHGTGATTAGAVVTFGPGPLQSVRRPVVFHPSCPCQLLAPAGDRDPATGRLS